MIRWLCCLASHMPQRPRRCADSLSGMRRPSRFWSEDASTSLVRRQAFTQLGSGFAQKQWAVSRLISSHAYVQCGEGKGGGGGIEGRGKVGERLPAGGWDRQCCRASLRGRATPNGSVSRSGNAQPCTMDQSQTTLLPTNTCMPHPCSTPLVVDKAQPLVVCKFKRKGSVFHIL